MPTASGYKTYQELKETKPVRWWHAAIIDDMIAFPLDTLEVRGKRLNYAPAYLSIIMNTDMFKAAYEARRKEHSELLALGLTAKLGAVATKSLDIMLETLESKRTQIPFAALAKTSESTLQALGYGLKEKAVNVNVDNRTQNQNVVVVTAEQLAEARDALRHAEHARTIEHEPKKVENLGDEAPVLDVVPNPR